MAEIKGTGGADALIGTTLQDIITGWGGADTIEGGDDNDAIFSGSGDDLVFGGEGDDYIEAGNGNDTVDGGDGNDTVLAGEGDDLVYASSGADDLSGGKGLDTIDFGNLSSGVEFDVAKNKAEVSGVEQKIYGFETIIGSDHDDVIKGSKLAETIKGGDGDDVLRGRGGADVLTGGDGNDVFQWKVADLMDERGAHLGVDVITDFGNGDALDVGMLLGGVAYNNLADVVRFTDVGKDSVLQVKINDAFVDVAELANKSFADCDVDILASDGMFLV